MYLVLTTLEFFETILTAASSVKCSQRPSVANIKNMSWGCNFRTNIEGTAVITGLFKGTGIPKWKRGSLLNSGFFKYTSPIDLETYKGKVSSDHRQGNILTKR